MKSPLIILFSFWCSVSLLAQAQDPTILYVDKYDLPTEKEKAAYYREVRAHPDNKSWVSVKDFYNSNVPKQTGTFTDLYLFGREGEFVEYHENGNKKSQVTFNKGKRFGVWKTWYYNGQLREQRNCPEKGPCRLESFYDSLGNKLVDQGRGRFVKVDDEDVPVVILKGPVEDGLMNGTFTGYLKDGFVYCTEEYQNNKLIKGISNNQEGDKFSYTELEEFPNFIEFTQYMKKNMRYPASARRTGISGTVYIRLFLGPDTRLLKAVVVRGISEDINEEAMRVVLNYKGMWGPFIKRGQTIQVESTILPVAFKLN